MFRIYEKDVRRGLLVGVGSMLFAIAAAHGQDNAASRAAPEVAQGAYYATPTPTPAATATHLPGWISATAEMVSPEEALEILGTGSDAPHSSASKREASVARQSAAFASPQNYAELADALENDPLRIYQYVRNHFEYVPYFGLLKGPYLTLHERSGNDFDQAALLIELLRAAGIPARFQFGSVSVTSAHEVQAVADWLGTDTDLLTIARTFSQGGVPVSLSASTVRFSRVWVEATIKQETILLDPAFKASTRYSTINLGSAMNYTQAGLLAAAGGSKDALSISGMNWSALADYLGERTTDLQNYLTLNHPNDRVEELLGGFKIIPDNTRSLPATLPLPVTGTILIWDVVPASYLHTLRLRHGGIDITKNISDIAGRKVSLTYSGDNPVAQLYIDDQLQAEGTPPSDNNLNLSVNHPYAGHSGKFADQSRDFNLKRSGTYVIVSAFGGDKHSTLLSERQRRLNRMSVDGTSLSATERLTETLNVIGQTWMHQTQLSSDLLYTLSGKRSIRHHRFGIAGQEEGYFVDMAAQVVSTVDRVAAPKQGEFKAQSFIASAMEHSVLDQLQGISDSGGLTNPAVSTIRLLAVANEKGDRLYVANRSNYASISSQLRNYSTAQLDQFQSLALASHTLVIPEDGAISVRGWTGHGYVDSWDVGDESSMGMIIGGGLNGGIGTTPGTASSGHVRKDFLPEIGLRKNIPITPAADPVDLGTGAFISSLTDFGVAGSGTRGLAFTRSYNSQMASQDTAGLGRGWTHNYNIYLSSHSDAEAALGGRTIFDAIPMVIVSEITRSLLRDKVPSPRQWGVAALVANWGMDQLLYKSITVQMGSEALTYQELPNGEFIAPAGVTTALLRVGDTYELQERFGTVWKFDADDRIASIEDVDGKAMKFTYDEDGRLAQVRDAYSRTLYLQYASDALVRAFDSTLHVVTYEHKGGNLTKVNGLENGSWTYEYDRLHRLETVKNPVNVQIVDNTYNDFDRVIEQKAPRDTGLETYKLHYGGFLSSEEDPEGNRTTYHFDPDGRRIAVEDALGHTTRIVYDGQGHAVEQTDPRGHSSSAVYDGDGNLLEEINDSGNKVTFTYDAKHRLIEARDPLNHKVNFEYDARHHLTDRVDHYGNKFETTYLSNGLVDATIDPRGSQTRHSYDGHGYLKTAQTGGHPGVNWRYNIRGDLEKLVDQEGAMTSFIYNNRGLVRKRTDPLGRSSTREYTAAGKLKVLTDRRNRSTKFTYTDSGKLDEIAYPGSDVNFNYDNRDHLVEMIDSTGSSTSAYDAAGRLTGHINSNGQSTGYDYDAVGNLTTLTYPGGNKKVRYTYDNLNRLSTVTIDWLAGKPTMQYVYDDASRLDMIEHFNAMETDYTWDDANRLTGISHEGATPLVEYSFVLDAGGNRVQETISPGPIIHSNLLADDTSFAYNLQRNRLNSTSSHTYTYGNQGQLTGTIDAVSKVYAYDSEGQLAGQDAVDYTFDDAHRLIQRGNHSFVYDGVGNRLRAIRSGKETQYVYDAAGNLLAQANSKGQITRYYIYGAGLTAMVAGGTFYVYHFDGTGHTVALTNASNAVVNKYAYSPYGQVLGQEQGINQPFKYAGQVGIFTESDNLYYMRARYYDAQARRFISEDPAGFVDGPNLYAYVGGNPVGAVDPTGQFAFLVPGLVGGFTNLSVTASFGGKDLASLSTAFGIGFFGGYIPGGAAGLAVNQATKAGLKLAGGAIAGGATNAGGQAVNNIQAGRSASEINLVQVGVSAAGGLVATGAVLSAGAGTLEKVSAGVISSKFSLASGAANKIISGK